MDLVIGVQSAILLSSLIFSGVFGWLYICERSKHLLFWSLGCLLYCVKYLFFWRMIDRLAAPPVLLALTISAVMGSYILIHNGIWAHIGIRHTAAINLAAGCAHFALICLCLLGDTDAAPAYIAYAYLCGGCLSAYSAVRLFLLPRVWATLFWRLFGGFCLGWFVYGIWILVSIYRQGAFIWLILCSGLLYISTVVFLLLTRLDLLDETPGQKRIETAASALRMGWFEIIPDKEQIIISPQTYRVLGYGPYEFPANIEEWLGHMDEAGRERARNTLYRIQGHTRPRSFTCEYMMRAKDGRYRWIVSKGFAIQINPLGKPIRYVAISFDMTEEKRMADKLDENNRQITLEEEQKKAILDSIPDTMLYLDLEWCVLMANAPACALFKCSFPQMRGKALTELMGPEQNVADLCLSLGNEGRAVTDEIETLSGRFWRLRINPVSGPAGDRIGYVLVIEDRTQQHLQEEQRVQVEKMMAIGQMAGGLAHDLKNQMMVTLGNLTLIEEAMNKDSKAYEYIKRVENATKGTKELIDNLLAFARKRPIEYARMDTHEVIESSVQLLRHGLTGDVTIQTSLHAGKSVIRGDIYQMQNAIFNLAINARDAMPDGGFLSIETHQVSVEEAQLFQYSQRLEPGDYIRISISDTGCGMDEFTVRRIFEPFFTTKPPGKGTGLGLSMVFGTVQAHHGAINVFSQPGEGTIFDIYLPLIDVYEEEQYTEDGLAQYRLM